MTGPSPDLLRRGEGGDPSAQIALGRHYEAQKDVRMARGWFSRAAKAGSVEAMRLLAINLLSRDPIMGADGVGIIRMAAHRGDAHAAHICALLAAQDINLDNRWEIAIACLRDAADRGWEPARSELHLLTGSARGGGHAPEKFDAAAFVSPRPLEAIIENPRISIIRECLQPEACDWLMTACRPRLQRSAVYDPQTGGNRVEGARSNSQVAFDVLNASLVIMMLRARIEASLNAPRTKLELTTLLHYDVGEEFTPHYDYFDPANPTYAREIARRGQRIATVLIYLNDDFEGGETEFPKIGLRHKGRKGDALLFWNVDAAGAPDPLSFHAGRPPTRGEKWVISQWIRTEGAQDSPG